MHAWDFLFRQDIPAIIADYKKCKSDKCEIRDLFIWCENGKIAIYYIDKLIETKLKIYMYNPNQVVDLVVLIVNHVFFN